MTEDEAVDELEMSAVIADNMRLARLARRLKQRELAALLNVSPATISHMENRTRVITTNDLRPICEALGVTIWDLTRGLGGHTAAVTGLDRRRD